MISLLLALALSQTAGFGYCSAGSVVQSIPRNAPLVCAANSPAAGTNTMVQFNDGGSLGGSSGLTYNKDTGNVGMGTAPTSYPLSIYRTNADSFFTPMQRMQVTGTATGRVAGFTFSVGATNFRGGRIAFGETGGGFLAEQEWLQFQLNGIEIGQAGPYPISFKTNNATRLTIGGDGVITSGGNVIAPTFIGALTGNASTATSAASANALAANGTNCGAAQAAIGVDAAGNAEGCWTPFNFSGLTTGGVLYATSATAVASTAAASNATVLHGGAPPAFGPVDLGVDVGGTLTIYHGGTNSTATPTAGGVGYGTGSAHAYTAAGTAGQVLISNGASAPTFSTNIVVGGVQSTGTVSAGQGTAYVTMLDTNVGGWAGIWSGSTNVGARTTSNYSFLTDGGYTYLNVGTGLVGALRVNNTDALSWASSGVVVTGTITATGDITAYYSSDRRLKDLIHVIDDPLDKLAAIHGVEWEWNAASGKSGHGQGLIAQDVAKVVPSMVGKMGNGYLGLKVGDQGVVALLVEGMKAQQQQIEDLKREVAALKEPK